MSDLFRWRLTDPPPLAVIIATWNRAALLAQVLDSLVRQSVPRSAFEVIVVDDGSVDETPDVAARFATDLTLTLARQRNAGLASARNHGLFLTQSPLLLFLDDDDVAQPHLIEEHLRSHARYPDDQTAVLGYTNLDETLTADPLMNFVTEVDGFLFSYPALRDGDVLDFSYFWGGRTSCKRAFLIEHGIFNPVFRFGCEDVELGFRLSRHGLRVVFNARAISTTRRGIEFDGFCHRLFRQGCSSAVFSRLHPDDVVRRWCEVDEATSEWKRIGPVHEKIVGAARRLDQMARMKAELGFRLPDADLRVLHDAYRKAFRTSKFKGIIETMNSVVPTAAA